MRSETTFQRIISNTGILAISRIVNAALSFIYIPLSIQALGLTEYGYLLIIIEFVTLVSDITQLKSWQTLLHYGTDFWKHKNIAAFQHILGLSIRFDLISSFAGAGISFLCIHYFNQYMLWPSSYQHLAELATFTILFMNTGWSNGILQLDEKFKAISLFQAISSCIQTTGCFIGSLFHLKIDYFLIIWMATQISLFIFTSAYAAFLVKDKITFRKFLSLPLQKIEYPSGIVSFTIKTSLSDIIDEVFQKGSFLFISKFLGPQNAAIYRVTRKVSTGISHLSQLMVPTIYPVFVQLRNKNEWALINKSLSKFLALFSKISFVCLGIAIFFGNFIMYKMMNIQYSFEKNFLILLLISSLIDMYFVPVRAILIVSGKVSLVLLIRSIVITLYFPVSFFAMKYFQLMGTAYSAVLSSAIIFIYSFAYTKVFLSQKTNELLNS
ncbi:lipopolysaccharide biosynthesis protein [Swingsia samuiensis]|uniref:Lipopolysaccharide biosynthesis protein n=1 Tax=Swingsia samuiensis TaxID=1293412 RepID=A0A4Y6UI69_9PROT|nr:oligosaccharide flippase family protein [Swingsia samuiensis]QDH16744.1 hypothetical protein E3D00_03555 [Swingsia samuiensis]